MIRNDAIIHRPADNRTVSAEFVAHFDASYCDILYSGDLEQLAIVCPKCAAVKFIILTI